VHANRLGYFHRLVRAAGLTVVSVYSLQTFAQDTGRLDPTFEKEIESFSQWADVNGDGNLDKCAIVGSADKRYVHCTLGPVKEVGAKSFDSAVGTDVGYPPRILADVDGNKKADFCRMVMVNLKTPRGRPTMQTKVMRCLLAGESSFGATDYDPNTNIKKPWTRTLYAAPDGTAIYYLTNTSDGSWYAHGVDAKGQAWRLEGEATKNGEAINSGMRLRGGEKEAFLDSGYTGQAGLIINQSMSWVPDNTFNFRIVGAGIPLIPAINPAVSSSRATSYKGFEYDRGPYLDSNGYSTVKLTVWNCGADPNSTPSCTQYFSGKQYKPDINTGKVAWEGQPPQPLANYFPDQELPLISYFKPVLDAQFNAAGALLLTGNEGFDTTPWYDHSSSDWLGVNSFLTAQGQAAINRGQFVATFVGLFISGAIYGVAATLPVGGPALALAAWELYGTSMGTVFALAIMQQTSMDAIAADAEYCKSVRYSVRGCEEYEFELTVTSPSP
jgi:hypothetical protein